MKLTKEQKSMLIDKLSSVYGTVSLLCDGQKVTLQVQQTKPLKFSIVVYVNGWWCGEWMNAAKSFPEQKFMRKVERPACSPKMRAAAEKAFGKRAIAKDPFYSGTITIFDIGFPSGMAAISHLCKVCESIEIIQDEEIEAKKGGAA